MNFTPSPAPTVELTDEIIQQAGVKLFVKRLDLIHPFISGNKWFKLKYNLEKAKAENYTSVLTYGGAYSNHIAATAAAAKLSGFNSIGIIRGEKPAKINPVLEFASEQGMKLVFVSREDYRNKDNADFLNELKVKFDNPFVIPEGGANAEGIKGCSEILSARDKEFDYIFCACGTATTFAGLILSCKNSNSQLKGVSILKGAFFLSDNVSKFISGFDNSDDYKNREIIHNYHFGGYAKSTHELKSFINNFISIHNFIIEPVYTGKVFIAVYDLLKNNYFAPGSQILVIHTGGFNKPY